MKIKILHIITRMEEGGAPKVLLDVIPKLNPLRYNTTLISGITKDPKRELIPKVYDLGIKLEIIPSMVREVNFLKDTITLLYLISYIRKSGCHIVHTHTSKAGILGRIAAQVCGVNVIVHSTHGTIFYGYFNPLFIKLFIILEKMVAYKTDKIICLSNKEINEHLERGIGNKNKFITIYNGIDINKFRKLKKERVEKRKELALEKDNFLGAVIGRLEKVKGQRYLLEAVPQIIKDIPNFQLLVIGEGDELNNLKKFAEQNKIYSNVRFLGHRDDVAEILSAIDCFYLPSLNEGFGISLLEAMVMKKAIIASKVGGIPEVVTSEETGILIPPKDPKAIAQATLRLFKDPEFKISIGVKGYNRVQDLFTIEKQVRSLESLYEEVLKQKVI